jgi:hypothetical protein
VIGEPLAEDRPQDAQAIPGGSKLALAEEAFVLDRRHLDHAEPGTGDANVDQGLDLEAVARHVEVGQAVPPERVVAVAEVRVARPEEDVTSRFNARLPRRRAVVMSSLAPPGANREPLAKSPPAAAACPPCSPCSSETLVARPRTRRSLIGQPTGGRATFPHRTGGAHDPPGR